MTVSPEVWMKLVELPAPRFNVVAAANGIAEQIFSMTDQQLPPCDTEPSTVECETRDDGTTACWVVRAAAGGEPSSDAKTDYDHIWRCIQQAARGE